MLDAETGEPITTEGLRYGFRVAVVALPCDIRWRSEAGLRLVGPEYFGYDIPYLPIEERVLGVRESAGGKCCRRHMFSRYAATGETVTASVEIVPSERAGDATRRRVGRPHPWLRGPPDRRWIPPVCCHRP